MPDTDTVTTLAGRSVHRMGFGAMQLPGPGVFGPPKDRATALAILRRVVDAGVNHIDTAQFYGPDVANELIREALHPYPDDLVLVSKVGAQRDGTGQWLPAQRPEELRAGIEANLASLALDQVPVVNLRRHHESDVPFDEQLAAMVALRDEGLIGGVGLSTVSLDEYHQGMAATPIACVQNAFSVADRSDQDVFDACVADGVPYVPYFPLGSAFVPDKPVLNHPAVVASAERLGATPAQVALAWLLQRAPNVLLIPGTSSLEHLEQNLAAVEVALDQEALVALG
ncbi:MAG TPA: oxidoreductase [Acidimicrobiales bacterium]|jgi:aryl-alcohol dehydrogenase-like predicted oxidoreductase